MNIIKIDNIEYNCIFFWRDSKKSKSYDSNGHIFPFPKDGHHWTNKKYFLQQLRNVEKHLEKSHKYIHKYKNQHCLLCDNKNITSKSYISNKMIWENSVSHYIKIHNIKPPKEFLEMIYTHTPQKLPKKTLLRINGQQYSVGNMSYIKLGASQLLILDALMRHGGYDKKYPDKNNKKIYRYSEHAGLLDFNDQGLERIIVSGNTDRIDTGDDEIFLPSEIKDIHDYEYIFHTHPPTPKPGGRVKSGVLYEFPSVSDILHFVEHYNDGLTQGSIVVASEGLYNIHKYKMNKMQIQIDEDKLSDELSQEFGRIQMNAIEKHGTNFTTYYFYSIIAQDTDPIRHVNKILKKYDMYIDYFPRQRSNSKKWIIESVFLPIRITEPSNTPK